MSIQQVRINPYYAALRNVASDVGLRKCSERAFAGMPGSIGIWLWVDLTIKEVERLKKRGEWPFNVPDIETVRRRIAYLADPEHLDDGLPRPQDSFPLWKHLTFNIGDTDPRTGHVRQQSGYAPSEARQENSAQGESGSSRENSTPVLAPPTLHSQGGY